MIPNRRPVLVCVAGPNGAGKTTFFHTHLAASGLRWVNADELAETLALPPYAAAELADAIRRELARQGESFIFETVFSDPVGAKVAFLAEARVAGYFTVLCFIGLPSAEESDQRVAMRASQGGHDVPPDKIASRYPRSLGNLAKAIPLVDHVLVFDNSDLSQPFRKLAECESGEAVFVADGLPVWFADLKAPGD